MNNNFDLHQDIPQEPKIKTFFSKNAMQILLATLGLFSIAGLLLAWSMTNNVNKRISNIENYYSTSLPYSITQSAKENSQLSSINERLLNLDARLNTVESILNPTQTTTLINPEWKMTKDQGFFNDVRLEDNGETVIINGDRIRTNKGFVFMSLDGVKNLSFNLKISKFPNLDTVSKSMVYSDNNYQLFLGITDGENLENDANINNYIRAKIFPYVKYDVKEKTNIWNCCRVESQSSFNDDDLTQFIPDIKLNDLKKWNIKINNRNISISIGNLVVSDCDVLDDFSNPVFYIGYYQSPDCWVNCPVHFELTGLEINNH
jgi:hypothetical protein